jgi:polar amino acid transport system substrate-binding protein
MSLSQFSRGGTECENKKSLALVVVVCLMTGNVFAAGESRVSLSCDGSSKRNLSSLWQPAFIGLTTKDGEIIGMEIDLARLFAVAMEVKLTLKSMHFNELLPALEKGQIDMVLSAMTITPQRNLKFAFAGPYFASGKSVLTKGKNVGSVDEISKMNNPDKILVALKGSTSQMFVEKLMPKATLVQAEDYDKAVTMVRNDKAVAMIADYPICMVSVYRYPDAGLVTLGKPISYEPLGVALPPNDPLLVNWVQNSLHSLEKSGELLALMERWFKDTSWIKRLQQRRLGQELRRYLYGSDDVGCRAEKQSCVGNACFRPSSCPFFFTPILDTLLLPHIRPKSNRQWLLSFIS